MFPQAVFAPVGQVSGPAIIAGAQSRNDVFVFDLDALVPGRFGQMDPAFAAYLCAFAQKRPCYIVSSASYSDMLARLPGHVRSSVAGIFALAGTELWGKYDIQARHEHDFSDELYEFMVKVVQKSRYPAKMAPMLESGSATLRLSLAGSRATSRQLKDYLAWEEENRELREIEREFRVRFPNHEIYQDTATSFLVMPQGLSTALVVRHLKEKHTSARLIGYVTPRFAATYGKPMCEEFAPRDILSAIGGPGDVSQLLSYEMRQMAAEEHAPAPAALHMEGV